MFGEKKTKKTSEQDRVSVYVSDKKGSDTVDIQEIDMKITKIESMLSNVNRRIDAHQRKLEKIYESDEVKHARETMDRLNSRVSSGS